MPNPEAPKRLEFKLKHPLSPYLSRNKLNMFSSQVKQYHASQSELRSLLKEQNLEPFSKKHRIQLSVVIVRAPEERPHATSKSGTALYRPARRSDLSNFVKAVEDAIQPRRQDEWHLIPNDAQIWRYGHCEKREGTSDLVHVVMEEIRG